MIFTFIKTDNNLYRLMYFWTNFPDFFIRKFWIYIKMKHRTFNQKKFLNYTLLPAVMLFLTGCEFENFNINKLFEFKNAIFSALQKEEKEPPVTQNEMKKMKYDFIVMMGEFSIFQDPEMESIILEWQMNEWRKFGTPEMRSYHKTTSYKNTVIMQRSARKRLYDHNIILRNLFKDKIIHKQHGNLSPLFQKALFLDIGSAILIEEGAPTVRDIFEDERITEHFSAIIATDINEPGARFIETYTKERQNLPFPVREVSVRIVAADQWFRLTEGLLHEDTPIILRSANSGPDLYYDPGDVKEHLRSVIRAFYDRNIIYFFNKFILLKYKNQTYFECIGRDSGVGVSHNSPAWESVDWTERKLNQSIIPETTYITLQE